MGTGDFTHPGWLKELKEKLESSEKGLFQLKNEYKRDLDIPRPLNLSTEMRFLLSTEVSSIYKKNGKVRKVHNVILSPNFSAAQKLQDFLLKIGGNITSDGRPILGLDAKDLLEMSLEASEQNFFIPAHIWTPWFSVLGSKSGFDSIEECFEDLTPYISAVETGLSTDAPMHWMCSFLDKFTLVSNSDAHSPEKLGRNANIFNTDLTYSAITRAIKSGDSDRFHGTIDLFPQEGKYHYDGHRKCGIRWDPVQTLQNNETCPQCGKKVTVGVMNRVVELSDRDQLSERPNRLPFRSIIPLKEILSEITGVGPFSKTVDSEYFSLIRAYGPELNILLDLPVQTLRQDGWDVFAEAVERMRHRQVLIQEGYDGEYGRIKVFQKKESIKSKTQDNLFPKKTAAPSAVPKRKIINFDLKKYRKLQKQKLKTPSHLGFRIQEHQPPKKGQGTFFKLLNKEQKRAVSHEKGPALILAGPGTGKTHTLCCRIAYLIHTKKIHPEKILAVTFTNKAAQEMKKRLREMLGIKAGLSQLTVATFHAFGYEILKKNFKFLSRTKNFSIIGGEDQVELIRDAFDINRQKAKSTAAAIKTAKQNLLTAKEIKDPHLSMIFQSYEDNLKSSDLFDIDDCIYRPFHLLSQNTSLSKHYQDRFSHLLVDEFQDINSAQYQTIRMLMPHRQANIFIIGDPNQAIYGFRGADVRFLNQFLKDRPNAVVYRLKQSYRCSDLILKASGGLMQRSHGSEKDLLSGLCQGVKVNLVSNATDRSEAEFVARKIEEIIGGVRFFSMDSDITQGEKEKHVHSLADFAVLCRTKKQMKPIEKALNDHSIPFQKVGNIPFFREEPIKSLLDVYKLAVNPSHVFLRKNLLRQKKVNIKDITTLTERISHQSVTQILDRITKKIFQKQLQSSETKFKKLMDMAQEFENKNQEFIKHLSLCSGSDTYDSSLECVAVMTLHTAKGLEFPCVFITGCEQGILPYSLFPGHGSDIDEERRLLYVGMTRAKKYLFLTYAKKRFIHSQYLEPEKSIFLEDIEKEFIKKHSPSLPQKKDSQIKLF
ncbi:MAG: AAA family ATPase [Candidatus Aminicenantes bacterium]|nr:AAA family ATPase [Candidatus Aminicenantes bacterium]